jgi:hypothetical protein
MDRVIGILFFYTIVFLNKEAKYDKEWKYLSRYLKEKADRYLGIDIQKNDWELLKIHLKDLPEPNSDKYLSDNDILKILDVIDEVFGETFYEIEMHGVSEEEKTFLEESLYNDFKKHIEVFGSFNGLSIVLGNWLSKSNFDRKLIEREYNLKNLI